MLQPTPVRKMGVEYYTRLHRHWRPPEARLG